MRILVIALALATSVVSADTSQADGVVGKEIGSWRVGSSTDTMTDRRTVFAINHNSETAGGQGITSLSIHCAGPTLEVFLHTEGFWLTGLRYLIAVTYRVDDQKPRRDLWFYSQTGKGANITNPALISAMRKGSRIRFRVDDFSSSPEAVFDLQGTPEAFDIVARECAATRRRPAVAKKGT